MQLQRIKIEGIMKISYTLEKKLTKTCMNIETEFLRDGFQENNERKW